MKREGVRVGERYKYRGQVVKVVGKTPIAVGEGQDHEAGDRLSIPTEEDYLVTVKFADGKEGCLKVRELDPN